MFQKKRKTIILALLLYWVSYMIYMWMRLYKYVKLKMTQRQCICKFFNLMYNLEPVGGESNNIHFPHLLMVLFVMNR